MSCLFAHQSCCKTQVSRISSLEEVSVLSQQLHHNAVFLKKQEGKCKAHHGPYIMTLFTSPLSLDSKLKILTLSPLQPFFEPGTAWHSKEQLQRRLDYTLDIQGCFEINVFDFWKLVSDDSFHQLPYYCGTTFVRQNSESIFSVNGL